MIKQSGFNNKKGQASQNIFIGIIALLAFGLTSIFGSLIGTAIIAEYTTSGFTSQAMQAAANGFNLAYRALDATTLILMVVFIIGIAMTSFRVATAPIFFIVTFIMAGFYGFVAYIFSFMFTEIISEPVFLTITALFPATILICTNLHWVALANIVVGAIALYAKKEKGQFIR